MGIRHDQAIRAVIVGDATIQGYAPAQSDGRKSVFKDGAPPGSTMPYIIFGYQAGGRDNRFAGNHEDLYYFVKCVADNDANGKLLAEQAATAIEAAFHRPASDPTLGESWILRVCNVTGEISYDETADDKTYHHAGRIIRLRGDK